MSAIDLAAERDEMVRQQIEARGIRDSLVLDAMRAVPREEFLPKPLREFAYRDMPLPIASKQTISQPYIVAFMIEALALKNGQQVLEIGAGSGYAAAILAMIAEHVYAIERLPELADQATSTLKRLGFLNVQVRCGDGTLGWPDQAPFDAIVVAASGPTVPRALKSQLRVGGRMVIPIGSDSRSQKLLRITRCSKTRFKKEDIGAVRFVPLIGVEAWKDGQAMLRPS